MEIDAKNLVAVYYDQNHKIPGITETFIKHMDAMFIDPNAANRALSKLTSMSQSKKESFATFLPKFERTMAESLVMENRARISYLHSALTDTLRLALASRDMPDEYDQYVISVAKVASALELPPHQETLMPWTAPQHLSPVPLSSL